MRRLASQPGLTRRTLRGLVPQVLPLLVTLAATTGLHAQPNERLFRSEEYKLQISLPDSWRLLPTIKELVPDAMVGAVSEQGVYGVIIAESAPGVELAPFAELLYDNVPFLDKELAEFRAEQTYLGRPAVGYSGQGTNNGLAVRFRNTVFRNGDFLFQVSCFGLSGNFPDSGCRPFERSLKVLEGEVTGATEAVTLADTSGPGWRLTEGVYESSSHRLKVQPKERWKVAVGDSLSQMNPDAAVGLVHIAPEAYIAVIPERVPEVAQGRYLEQARADFGADLGLIKSDRRLQVEIAGRPLALALAGTDGQPEIDFWHGTFTEDDRAYQVFGWYLRGLEEQALPALEQGFGSIELLAGQQLARLEKELASDSTQRSIWESATGPSFSLRNGVYRDFAGGFELRKPTGNWTLIAGDAAHQQTATELVMRNDDLGLTGLIWTEPASGQTARQLLEQTVLGFSNELPPISELSVEGATAVATMVPSGDPASIARYLVAAVAGETAVVMEWLGYPAHLEQAQRHVLRAVAGLRFPREMATTHHDETGYSDFRLGYRVASPEGWRFVDTTPDQIRPLGSVVSWSKGDRVILVMALLGAAAGEGTSRIDQIVQMQVKRNLADEVPAEPVRRELRLSDRPATHMTWTGESAIIDAVTLVDGPWTYGIIANRAGIAGQHELDQFIGSFELLR